VSDVELLRWGAPGPYEVAFSTRHGGVSEGAFASLNLGLLTEDEPERVRRNRRLLCAAAGLEPERTTMVRQRHGSEVRRAALGRGIAEPAAAQADGDGLWSDEPGVAMLLLAADCLPIALARPPGREPALAVLHAGRRGLLAGVVAAGARVLGGGPLTAAIGPGIGPCCYEVGEEVARPFREAFGDDVARSGRLDLWTAAERALRGAGCESVERLDLCTSCDPERFFSHRRDGGRTGRQGVIARVAR